MRIFILAIFCAFASARAESQGDTLRLPLAAAESLFAANSAVLLAKKFEVEADRASALQAALWDNPNINVSQNIYNWRTGKYFDLGESGETAASLQQLIALAGKVAKRTAVEKAKGRISEQEFLDLLRTLKHALRSDFFGLHFQLLTLDIYDREMKHVGALLRAFQEQYRHGNVSMTELSRLRSLEFELESDRAEAAGDALEKRADLNLMLGLAPAIAFVPSPDSAELESLSADSVAFARLPALAGASRPDLRGSRIQMELAEANLAYQRALRIPDLNLGFGYDRSGGYIRNFNALTLSMDLPLWNRNQGNIKSAENQLKATGLKTDQALRQIESDVYLGYRKLIEAEALYRSWREPFSRDFDALAEAVYQSYVRKTISLLEFTDFFQSYKESKVRLYRLQAERINAYENVNYITGKDVFRLD